MNLFQAVVLGFVQGLTEFLPISSSAHLIIVPWLAGWPDPGLTFDVALHLGTLVAILAFFWREWVMLIGAFFASLRDRRVGADPHRRLVWLLLLGSIPGGIAGALGDKRIEQLFHGAGQDAISSTAILAIAGLLAALALLLWWADRSARHLRSLEGIRASDAAVVGLAQALAILPGVSRSGSTITAGLFLGLRRDAAARFSFLLATPIMAGAGLVKIADLLKPGATTALPLAATAVGFATAAVVGYLCIGVLLQFLQKGTMRIFVSYRLALALALVVLVLARH